jgi:hypothetical protein
MGSIRTLIAPIAAAIILVPGFGCKGTGWKTPEGVPTAPLSSQVKPEANPIVQAGGTSPFANLPSSLNWITGKSSEKAAKGTATEIAVAWQNHIDYLPDPTRQGAMGPGLACQMFLFDSHDHPAQADGTLTVDIYDETIRPNGQPRMKPERWQLRKDILKSLRTVDERFGPTYVLFLPWPSYRPDVTRVRITVRFDPDQKGAFTLYAPESKLNLGPSPGRGSEIGATLRPEPPLQFSDQSSAAANSAPSSGPGMGVVQMNRSARPTIAPPAGLPPLGIVNPTGH